jgi:hypothetical protein
MPYRNTRHTYITATHCTENHNHQTSHIKIILLAMFYLPTDAQFNCQKTILKFTLKITLTF